MKVKTIITLGVCVALSLCSCQFKREGNDIVYQSSSNADVTVSENVESTEEEIITGKVLLLDYEEEQFETYNYGEALAQLILGMSEEESKIYQFDDMSPSKRETKTWEYYENDHSFSFQTNEYNKANSYGFADSMESLSEWEFRKLFLEEELDTCTREEAIAFCAPYASALGLEGENITIETYAITLDWLTTNGELYGIGAPDESYEYYTKEERDAKKAQGLEDEAMEMWLSNLQSNRFEDCPWKKEHEAILVVYRMHIDGIEINDTYQMATMIYVPYYEEIVCANGYLPFGRAKVLSEETLISKAEALSVASLKVGPSMVVKDIVLTYILLDEDDMDGLTELKAIPTWRINYTVGNKNASIWIDALDGYVRE